jgi:ABC-type dipeptide/oligopeptide/nickel transport system ATPase component
VPIPETRAEAARIGRRVDLPQAAAVPGAGGCAFRSRCPIAQLPICAEDPPLSSRTSDHLVACHFADGQRRRPPETPIGQGALP